MYKFKCEILDENNELIIVGSTDFDYNDVKSFGDCETIDDEVGKVMRLFVSIIEQIEYKEQIEDELPEITKNIK